MYQTVENPFAYNDNFVNTGMRRVAESPRKNWIGVTREGRTIPLGPLQYNVSA
jgi:hypothetical protein